MLKVRNPTFEHSNTIIEAGEHKQKILQKDDPFHPSKVAIVGSKGRSHELYSKSFHQNPIFSFFLDTRFYGMNY